MTAHWQHQREGGGRFAIWLIRAIALHGGRGAGRALLYPITLYFYLRRRSEREASKAYLARVFGRPATPLEVMRHIHCFASTLLDRIFLLAHGEKRFDIETIGLDVLDERIAMGRGVLLIGSHQGSFEALRALGARRPDIPLRVVLDKQKTPAMTMLLEALAPDVGARVIDSSMDGTSITLAMAEATRQGGMVALLADRGRAHEALRKAPLLGSPAPFPVGPWLVASALQVPVVLCMGLYMGGNRYKLIFEALSDRVEIPRQRRAQALDELISRYAQRVEHYARLAPYNWFNFYDFWQDTGVNPRADTASLVRQVDA
ncbi:putative LPLAT superfamily acyltransferase [Luteibacter rhizovicinus]|uniref:Putative LPLAT superfamily acyltransferase n=1 Tax=Luteibacter rhizovicinus TaxID=242606 RepID=A0A4R3YXT1_9GAMM|nr:acyltransferase [Luteibacter rhizovicinus]TCV96274.1 putative LPLAT superfamily acyltransferase [Luteibacter rhizovicinus]